MDLHKCFVTKHVNCFGLGYSEESVNPELRIKKYYPFGLIFNSYERENAVLNEYQNSGREKRDELGLNWLDFGARSYMADIGRWNSLDDVQICLMMNRHTRMLQ
jgi:RHS repeat-associated protein